MPGLAALKKKKDRALMLSQHQYRYNGPYTMYVGQYSQLVVLILSFFRYQYNFWRGVSEAWLVTARIRFGI